MCPIMQFHLDLLAVPFLVMINRRDVRDWGPIDDIPSLALAVLKPFLGTLNTSSAHDCSQEKRSPQNKMLEAALRRRLDDPAQWVAWKSLGELTPTWTSLEIEQTDALNEKNRLLQTQHSEDERGFAYKVS